MFIQSCSKKLTPLSIIEGLSTRKPYVTFHFVILKNPSFARVIGFSFIPNICTIDNKMREKGDKNNGPPIFSSSVEWGFEPQASYVDVVFALV